MNESAQDRVPRKSARRLRVLGWIVDDSDQGHPYRAAAAIEPDFFGLLEDGGFIEVREEGQHPLGGPARHVYITDKGRDLLRKWSAS